MLRRRMRLRPVDWRQPDVVWNRGKCNLPLFLFVDLPAVTPREFWLSGISGVTCPFQTARRQLPSTIAAAHQVGASGHG